MQHGHLPKNLIMSSLYTTLFKTILCFVNCGTRISTKICRFKVAFSRFERKKLSPEGLQGLRANPEDNAFNTENAATLCPAVRSRIAFTICVSAISGGDLRTIRRESPSSIPTCCAAIARTADIDRRRNRLAAKRHGSQPVRSGDHSAGDDGRAAVGRLRQGRPGALAEQGSYR